MTPMGERNRELADRGRLDAVVRAGLGTDRRVDEVIRLRGGSKKGVYRIAFDDRSTVVAYVWAAGENFWPARPDGADPEPVQDDLFSDASGSELFVTANAELTASGIRTPEILLLDRSRSRYPADVALVEDVSGANLERRLAADPAGAAHTVARLGEVLTVLRRRRSARFGKVAAVAGATDPPPAGQRSAVSVVRDRALADLAEAAARDGRIAQDRRTADRPAAPAGR